jgi:hypothetical protein
MRGGITIQERPCPWCWNKFTARVGGRLSVCFNCREHWHGASPLQRAPASASDDAPFAPFTFTSRETDRLATYRAAVHSGYFTDWPRQPLTAPAVSPRRSPR